MSEHHHRIIQWRLFGVSFNFKSVADEDALQKDLDTIWLSGHRDEPCSSIPTNVKPWVSPGRGNQVKHHTTSLASPLKNPNKSSALFDSKVQNDLHCHWNGQTIHATVKATSVINFLSRNFHHCSTSVKEKFYITFIRSHLDSVYTVAAWNPYKKYKYFFHQTSPDRQPDLLQFSSKSMSCNSWSHLNGTLDRHRFTCFYIMLNS